MEDAAKEYQKKRRIQMIALSIAGVFIVVGIVMWTNKDKFINYDVTLAMQAKAVNLTCPQMVDEDTRLDSATTEPGRNFINHYTAINLEREGLDMEIFCDAMRDAIVENMKGNFSVADFGKNNVIVTFRFNDKNGVELCNIRVLPEEWYRKPKKAPADSLNNPTP